MVIKATSSLESQAFQSPSAFSQRSRVNLNSQMTWRFWHCGFTLAQWAHRCVSRCSQMASASPLIQCHFFPQVLLIPFLFACCLRLKTCSLCPKDLFMYCIPCQRALNSVSCFILHLSFWAEMLIISHIVQYCLHCTFILHMLWLTHIGSLLMLFLCGCCCSMWKERDKSSAWVSCALHLYGKATAELTTSVGYSYTLSVGNKCILDESLMYHYRSDAVIGQRFVETEEKTLYWIKLDTAAASRPDAVLSLPRRVLFLFLRGRNMTVK